MDKASHILYRLISMDSVILKDLITPCAQMTRHLDLQLDAEIGERIWESEEALATLTPIVELPKGPDSP